ncbi:hypothetical protein SAMN04487943_10874 [Gracilibacillus orientalis]|uniref:Endospore appendages core domain-containing protein n=1 Tax=Gracilibacillus orientalis TaxID=334253 RepID=A0A1I4NBE0_9BACI|nr:S-Ena type endospore appendage [Gracilibacillus orientalis]SFM12543.1 hypothetical protein SAMN04487943_10874 [Gracilibacillus orientalis]
MSEHCMKVPIVYDWITIDEEIRKCKLIPLGSNVKQLEDCICINFNVNCQSDTPTTIWQAVGDKISAATFSIEHEGTCSCDWVILANDEEISRLSQGNTFSGTVGDLERLSVLCVNDCLDGIICEGTLNIVVHYLICAEIKSEKNQKMLHAFYRTNMEIQLIQVMSKL